MREDWLRSQDFLPAVRATGVHMSVRTCARFIRALRKRPDLAHTWHTEAAGGLRRWFDPLAVAVATGIPERIQQVLGEGATWERAESMAIGEALETLAMFSRGVDPVEAAHHLEQERRWQEYRETCEAAAAAVDDVAAAFRRVEEAAAQLGGRQLYTTPDGRDVDTAGLLNLLETSAFQAAAARGFPRFPLPWQGAQLGKAEAQGREADSDAG